MRKIDNELIYMFDVDDTLVMWDGSFNLPGDGKVKIDDPYTKTPIYLQPHKRHCKLLEQMKGRGRFIVVWSAGGVQWAEAVVKALGLENSVDMVMTKPSGHVDDTPAEHWIGPRIYLDNIEVIDETKI